MLNYAGEVGDAGNGWRRLGPLWSCDWC